MYAVPYIRLDTHTDMHRNIAFATFSKMDVNENIHPTEHPNSSPSASARAREVGTEQDTLGKYKYPGLSIIIHNSFRSMAD